MRLRSGRTEVRTRPLRDFRELARSPRLVMLRALRWKEDIVVRIALATPLALLVVASAAGQPAPLKPASLKPAALKLEQIMADPGWIGAPVENAYWAADGKSVYYDIKRSGSPIR